jgi:microcystin-dependent protein
MSAEDAPFVAEIRIVAFNFAPRGWALCNGQILPISQNTGLFALLGTYYGGDGKSTFALPDLQGLVPIHAGQGNGLSQYFLGQQGGSETVTLLQSEIPLHNHTLRAHVLPGETPSPSPQRVIARSQNGSAYNTNVSTSVIQMAPQSIAPAGGSQGHNNMRPYLTLNFVIALQGVYPPRN